MKRATRNGPATLWMAAFCLVFLRAEACGPDVVDNPGFDLWCGDALCAWESEGEVERVPTWHRRDYGVALVGDPSAIRQLGRFADGPVECLQFELLVKKSDDAELFLKLDFQDDGVIEYSQPIPAGDWTPVEYNVRPPTWYSAVRFIVQKRGPGRAVLAQIRVRAGGTCRGEPVELRDLPLGARCETGDLCASGHCGAVEGLYPHYLPVAPACSTCTIDADCEAGETCGAAVSDAGVWRACVPAGGRALGERCAGDGECATGICCEGVCSTCCVDDDCDGVACAQRDRDTLAPEVVTLDLPRQCAPGGGRAEAGDRCLFDDDCQSGRCHGEEPLCLCGFEGWRCDELACEPLCFPGEETCNPRQIELGVRGGVCD